jgi:hypothetical protein
MQLFSKRICDAIHRLGAKQSLYHCPIPFSEPGDLRVGLYQDCNASGHDGSNQHIPPTICTGGFD